MPRRSTLRLIKRSVDALSSERKDTVFWDHDLAGFGVRVLPHLKSLDVGLRSMREAQRSVRGCRSAQQVGESGSRFGGMHSCAVPY